MVRIPELVGIVNVTPDSFSGDGLPDVESACAYALQLVSDGAARLDIGAESTRPGATALTPQQEWERLEPVVSRLRAALPEVPWSIDTRHAATAQRAVERGASWVNDVSGAADPAMRSVVTASGANLVLMHSLTVPPSRDHVLPDDPDPCDTIFRWAETRLHDLDLPADRVIFDPGIGFGKTPAQSLHILANLHRFRGLGMRILVGHSRKSWLAHFTPPPAAVRDVETVAASLLFAPATDYLRVHDVAQHARALSVLRGWPAPTTEMSLSGVLLAVHLGWSDKEQSTPQDVTVDFTVRFDACPPACATDDLSDTVNYADLARKTRQLTTGRTYRLIEHLGADIYRELRTILPAAARLRVQVAKLHPPMRDVAGSATFACGDFA